MGETDDRMSELMSKQWAVVGFDSDKAWKVMNNIAGECGLTVSRKIHSKSNCRIEFTDGTVIRWVPARESYRGFKFGKMWCDDSLSKEILDRVVMSSYFGKREDIIWMNPGGVVFS